MRSTLGLFAALAMLLSIGQASAAGIRNHEPDRTSFLPSMTGPNSSAISICPKAAPRRRSWWPSMAAAGRSAAVHFTATGGRSSPAAATRYFAIEYRLGKPGTYPAAVYDAKAAIQFVRAKAAEFDLDPDRIGLIGDSAGAYLPRLLPSPATSTPRPTETTPTSRYPPTSKAVVGFYGVYDIVAQWTTICWHPPATTIVEKFLGVAPMENRRVYFEASPISYATVDHNQVRFLLIHGTNDDMVDPESQSGAFLTALTQAGFFVRRIIIPGRRAFLGVRSVRKRAAQL